VTTARATQRPITDDPTTDHATTDQSSTEQRLKITSRRTHLGITIRRMPEPPQTGQDELIKETGVVDLETEVPRC
jgi:hypothetical protein